MSRKNEPPHDFAAEQSVLGSVLLADRVLDPLIVDFNLISEDFFSEKHRLIYAAMRGITDDAGAVDALTVVAHLRSTGDLETVGGSDYVHSLTGKVPAIANVRQYAQIIKNNALLRGLLKASYDIQVAVTGREAAPQELADRALSMVSAVSDHEARAALLTPDDLMNLVVEMSEDTEGPERFPSPWDRINSLTHGGFRRGNFIVIGAWSNEGKSILTDQWVEHIAKTKNARVCLFLCEMEPEERLERMIARHSTMTYREAQVRPWNRYHIDKLKSFQMPTGVHMQRAPGWSGEQIARHITRHRWDVCVIDTINDMGHGTGPGVSTTEAYEHTLTRLITAAKNVGCLLFVVTHLSKRSGHGDIDPRPQVSDLRWTAMLGNKADAVGFLYRKRDKANTKLPDAEFYFAKGRSIETGGQELTLEAHSMSFRGRQKQDELDSF